MLPPWWRGPVLGLSEISSRHGRGQQRRARRDLDRRALPLVGGLVDRLHEGIDVADIGCGSGHAINLMADAFPRSQFTGFDFSDTGLEAARAEAASRSLKNARFVRRDAASLGETAAFDFITSFDAVHDQARPDLMLAGIARALRPSGIYLCVDFRASSTLAENFDHPLGPFFYAISCMHCMTVSLADGGMGLGTMWGEQKAEEMLREAGFRSIETAYVEDDIVNRITSAASNRCSPPDHFRAACSRPSDSAGHCQLSGVPLSALSKRASLAAYVAEPGRPRTPAATPPGRRNRSANETCRPWTASSRRPTRRQPC